MNRTLQSARRVASVLLLSVVFAGCASGPNAASPDLQQRIETAHTRADHEALVTYYKAEAAAARAKVAEHRSMAKSYQGPFGETGSNMAAHCNSIVRMYNEIAAEYDGMAQFHQLLANEPALTKP